MIREIAELVELSKSTMQDIKAKTDNDGSPLLYNQTGCPLKINEGTEGHLKRIFREDPFASYKEINTELTKLDIFVCIEILRSTYDRFDSKSYRAAHKPRLTARHRKSRLRWTKEHLNWTGDQWRNVVWSDELRSCMEGSKRDQETYINTLANRFHPWFTNVMMYQERDFVFQEDGASCHTGGYARWWKETHQIREF
ncbi:hypothetical protein RO3G_14365 [Rhizopus delemar RA 99-880]|uniref:Transposase Tc1-like domain-containing protein n=1 Tax=Rhizopus delemar (strain RA 99-880 / ATCC MYA-4621 / FGSC 9543 / NRRL 43880) TaxID=246409 RepID=I1CMH4_RHIO9|nr:hypothetical protein RO3G_14365 [Rhizopus delemar RA 99-880]|eukprot:EIE89654.1 hypothetical protein RO3G_14365 [Rhizopus delemar RA 99-880]